MSLFKAINQQFLRSTVRLYSVSANSSSTTTTTCSGPAANASSTDNEVKIPKNLLEPFQTAHMQSENGAIVDKKPFKLHLEAGKQYSWCLCGKSKSQPICDGMHKNVHYKIKLRPIRFKVEKTGDYWLCNCKHTKNRPFCDGTHKEAHIQAAIK